LYAEDEFQLRDVTSKVLAGFTKQQYIAQDGKIGLELFQQHQNEIDIIITDINMPNLNGLEMAQAIKAINPNIPIIVATAFSNTEYLLEAINMGIDKYVLKPLDIKKLLQIMSQSLLYHELKDLYTDSLTHLPNRNRLKKDLEDNTERLIALINIDKFSTINDLYGEVNGDKVLLEFSQRLKDIFPQESYKIYRIEADKFVIIANDTNLDIKLFKNLFIDFTRILDFNEIIIDDNEIDINITTGIAKASGEDAYKYSQRAVGYARATLRAIVIYDNSLNIKENFEENIKWIKKLKYGFKNNKFKAYFQPIIDIKTNKIYKYESLIRYIEDDGTAIPPFKFLDIAKKAKLYPYIIKVMIAEAFALITKYNTRVAVNISYDDIVSQESMSFIFDSLEQNKQYTQLLEFEILESEAIEDFDIVNDFINKVKEYSCTIGIDDFGAGYSNFNMLVKLDVDYVKIDGSLINKIDQDDNLKTIVETIKEFSTKLHYKTVAEFVASKEILDVVASLNIDYAQGYYFSPPVSVEELGNRDFDFKG
jgi:diguanylate cyclase (GGDEF)-like protein